MLVGYMVGCLILDVFRVSQSGYQETHIVNLAAMLGQGLYARLPGAGDLQPRPVDCRSDSLPVCAIRSAQSTECAAVSNRGPPLPITGALAI